MSKVSVPRGDVSGWSQAARGCGVEKERVIFLINEF